jgi:ubiquinone/menaquinone biosynthesis C-methylase UbiE
MSIQDKYKDTNPVHRFFLAHFFRSFRQLLAPLPCQVALEVGSGKGQVLAQIFKAKPQAGVWGADINSEELKTSQMMHPEIPLLRADIMRLPFKDASVDLLVCLEVLEHLREPRQALLQLQRVASRYAIISVPHEPFFRLVNFARARYLAQWGNQAGHIQLWSRRRFLSLIKDYFRVVKIRQPFPWIMFLCEKK